MQKVGTGFEIIVYLHACKKNELLKFIKEEYFIHPYIARLFRITTAFHKKYGKIPFDFDNPSTEQISEIVDNNRELCQFETSTTEDHDQLKKLFMANINNVLSTSYSKYNEEYISKSFMAWVKWKNFEHSVDEALTYVKSQKIDMDNADDVINNSMQIFYRGNSMMFDTESSKSFWDADTHVQPKDDEVQKTGFPYLDLVCSKYGGLIAGQTYLFIGATNIGKSIVLINVAIGLAINGSNVCLASLEMAEYAIAARGGANVLKQDINKYDKFVTEIEKVQEMLDRYRKSNPTGKPVGELLLKQFHKATPRELDAWVLSEEKEKGIKINSLVIDYFGELGNDHRTGQGTPFEVYMYHKQNSQDLTSNGILNDYSVVSAHQDKEISKEATDIDLNNLSESKGISHKVDVIIGLIQPPSSKADLKFYMKGLKLRDSQYLNYWIEYDISYVNMKLTESVLLEPGLLMV